MLLLDTDVMVDIRRGFRPAIQWLASLQETPAVSVITVLELLHGCRNKQEQQRVEQLIERIPVVHLDNSASQLAVEYFRGFHLSHGIGVLDALVAAIAVSRGFTLCTFNEKHYRAIPELIVLQPYVRSGQQEAR